MNKNYQIVFFIVLYLFPFMHTSAQRIDKKLQHQVVSLVQGFHGDMGIYIKNLKNGKIVSIRKDSIFPTASIVKIPILIGTMQKIHKGELSYHQVLTYRDSLLYPGVDILGSFKDTEKIELSKLMMLSLTMSDNTASLWLQSLAGTGTTINDLLDSIGLVNTRVNSRTPGRQAYQATYGWGQTSPFEMAMVVEKIVAGALVNKELSAQMLRLLGRNYWDEEAISPIPSDVFVADKNGAVDASRSEVMFVNGKGARYILSIFTNNNRDQSWDNTNEAWVLTRKISKLVWDHYHK
ncbi:MAG: hypothetical protein NVS1B13_00570 [Flavisolibacter sp.]